MDDILSAIIGIAVAAILMFLFPLITMADRTDDVSQLAVKIATSEFANDVIATGKITTERYNQFITNLGSTGNTYNVTIEAKILDENASRLTTKNDKKQAGQNAYYSVFTSQILETITNKDVFYLKEGDIISVDVKNENQTIAQQLKNFFYTVVGKDTYIIAASSGGLVTVTGK